ncbi:hypothetical protein PENTCL1PPCAC_28634, partial [Pristionchus entomophagus]
MSRITQRLQLNCNTCWRECCRTEERQFLLRVCSPHHSELLQQHNERHFRLEHRQLVANAATRPEPEREEGRRGHSGRQPSLRPEFGRITAPNALIEVDTVDVR